MHSFDLHCVLRKTHIRDVMLWTELRFKTWALALSLSPSFSLPPSPLSLENKTVERIVAIGIAPISRKYLHLFRTKGMVVFSKMREHRARESQL